eukprot:CAMPEP_0179260400 /NCGR_PEP_ID=MMETSP0797-20121207/26321_1 /TAXON_ID=47934 /ORGANISM="Dinophysis acuminata, Strain DAEP01" /LENGTH=158 /DNA_ID=CAMNT_0020968481 /DNA_START=73 /DNA_END=547 /DNA_ORIENTATION=-
MGPLRTCLFCGLFMSAAAVALDGARAPWSSPVPPGPSPPRAASNLGGICNASYDAHWLDSCPTGVIASAAAAAGPVTAKGPHATAPSTCARSTSRSSAAPGGIAYLRMGARKMMNALRRAPRRERASTGATRGPGVSRAAVRPNARSTAIACMMSGAA